MLGVLPGIIGSHAGARGHQAHPRPRRRRCRGRILAFDALEMVFREYKLRVDPDNEVTWENRDRIEIVELEGLCMPHLSAASGLSCRGARAPGPVVGPGRLRQGGPYADEGPPTKADPCYRVRSPRLAARPARCSAALAVLAVARRRAAAAPAGRRATAPLDAVSITGILRAGAERGVPAALQHDADLQPR